MNYIMDLPTAIFVDLLAHAVHKDLEDKLWERWLAELPYMDKFIPFDEYKDKAFARPQERTDEEIIEDAEQILKAMSR